MSVLDCGADQLAAASLCRDGGGVLQGADRLAPHRLQRRQRLRHLRSHSRALHGAAYSRLPHDHRAEHARGGKSQGCDVRLRRGPQGRLGDCHDRTQRTCRAAIGRSALRCTPLRMARQHRQQESRARWRTAPRHHAHTGQRRGLGLHDGCHSHCRTRWHRCLSRSQQRRAHAQPQLPVGAAVFRRAARERLDFAGGLIRDHGFCTGDARTGGGCAGRSSPLGRGRRAAQSRRWVLPARCRRRCARPCG